MLRLSCKNDRPKRRETFLFMYSVSNVIFVYLETAGECFVKDPVLGRQGALLYTIQCVSFIAANDSFVCAFSTHICLKSS